MDIRWAFRLTFSTLAVVQFAAAQSPSSETPLDRINRLSDEEQIVLAKSIVDVGLPYGAPADTLYSLAVGRSSVILPIFEIKIEEVLKASEPSKCFTDKGTDPQMVVLYLWRTIARAGDQYALQQASKLLKIDEERFDRMVAETMYAAYNRTNPFTVAYQGFAIGDMAIDKRLVEWAEELLDKEVPNLGNPIFDRIEKSGRWLWAEALVDRYGAAPSPIQWMKDPIASRLKPRLAVLDYDVRRFAGEAAEKRARKQ
jgi:hypothetical protein